jgi:predicted nucleic acid-binding protein
MVAFDNTILSILLFPDAEVHEGEDAKPVERARDRVNALVQEIAEAGEQVLVPSPALAEVLATPACDMEEVLSTLRASAFIRIGDFDQRAAVELAVRLRAAVAAGDIREGLKTTKTQMKFDRQIVAIALTNGARVLYSDDDGVKKFGERSGLKVKRTSDLPIPAIQQDLFEGGKSEPTNVEAAKPAPVTEQPQPSTGTTTPAKSGGPPHAGGPATPKPKPK